MTRRILGLFLIFIGCAEDEPLRPIQHALNSESPNIRHVIDNLEAHEVQIKLSTIHKKKEKISFRDFEFQLDDNAYFYPASTVKFPVSLLTVEALQANSEYDLDTEFFVEGDSLPTTFRHEVRDIFAVSSNDTYNRLFDFLSKDSINSSLAKKGLTPSRFSHRLSTSDADNLTTRPLIFIENDSTLITTRPIINKPIKPLALEKVIKGKGYYSQDELIMEPMDFSEKNYLPISTLHNCMKRIIFPKAFSEDERFDISGTHRQFILDAMGLYPREMGYTSEEYYDSYCKFFIYGDSKDSIPEHMRILNKVGYAYGYLTDCAYIRDEKNDLEYILTATIHVNSDGIFNDDVYEYDTIGIPFLAELGRQIHTYLLEQKD